MSNVLDLTGRTFGELTAIRSVGRNKCGQRLWECSCYCGKTIVTASSSLVNGHTKTCGGGVHRIKDLTGMSFGKLIVIKRAEGKPGSKRHCAWWLCRCECGREKIIPSDSLLTGNTTSCGDCTWGTYEFGPGFVTGRFKDGETMLIDYADYPMVSKYRWWIDKGSGYFVTNIDNRIRYLHRMLMPDRDGLMCDHINRDKRDNRRSNLRYATPSQNSRNRSLGSNNTSGFIGVSWHIRKKKYVAQIKPNGRTINLGEFDDPVEAALVRDQAAQRFYGEYANLNFGGGSIENTEAGEKVHAALIAV